MSAKVAAKGHSRKHTAAGKAKKATAKHHPVHHKKPATHHAGHHVTAKGTHAHHAKAVGFAVGDLLPVCSFEALAMSLRLAGAAVSDDDMLGLWHLAGEREVSIAEALAAAARFGLAGFRPQWFEIQRDLDVGKRRDALLGFWGDPPVIRESADVDPAYIHALILGVDLPGPHAVLATPDGWWSWGQLWSPWTRAVSEAWAVSWA